MNVTKAAGITAVALAGYDTLVRPRMLGWGASRGEQRMRLPGDDIASGVPAHYTRAVTIQAPPGAVWPWLAQIGDHRASSYSHAWVERFYHDLLGLAICREFGPLDDPGLVFFLGQGLLEVSGHAAGPARALGDDLDPGSGYSRRARPAGRGRSSDSKGAGCGTLGLDRDVGRGP